MDIAVLGPLTVDGGSVQLSPRDRVVLAALTVRWGEEVPTELLADALWGDDPPASWGKVVPGCVMRLRRVLGAKAIETTSHGYRLVTGVDEVDSRRFERLVGRGSELLTLGEPDRAAYVFGQALSLWRGRALIDVEDWTPGRIEAGRLDELRLDAEEALLDARLRTGLHWELLGEAQSRVAEAPLRERRWALLAEAQYRAGRQGEALGTLRKARTVLVTELGLDPGPALVGLEGAILRQDPSLLADEAWAEPSAACPYLGLVPYDVGDADAFFGREDEVAECLRSLAEVGVLAVVGPSGSGKSSLVRAGLAAALHRDRRQVRVVTPGAHPMAVLSGVERSDQPSALVVDQCEEVVLVCADRAERMRFLAALADYADRGLLVVAIRADRLGDISAFPDFARLLERNLHLLSPMTSADFRAVIERPARQAGLLLEPGLVDLLLREVEDEPGALPLLSHALRQTWQRREGRTLTVAGYLETGGIRGAVAQSAEQVYEGLPAEQRSAMRDLLLRLVSPSPEGEPIRIRVPRRQVATDPERERLIERLVDARLVTSDDGVVEMAHEALARAWPRLRGWLDDDVEGQRIFRHLTMSAASWDSMGRPDSELYRGARLAQALGWRDAAHPDLTDLERDFLDASSAREASELRAAQSQVRRERRTVRRLRWLLAGVAVLGIVAGLLTVVATDQSRRAEGEARIAAARELAAAATANLEVDPELSMLLAVEAVARTRSVDGSVLPEAEEALHRAVVTSRTVLSVPGLGGAVDWSRTGLFVTEGPEDTGIVDIRDATTGVSVRRFKGHDPDVNDVAFSPDGSMLATTGDDGTLKVWDPATGELLSTVSGGPQATVFGPSFSADGSLVAAAWTDQGTVRVVDLSTGRVVRTLPDIPDPDQTAFSPNGRLLAVTGSSKVVVIDLDTGEEALDLQESGPAQGVAWSPDGRYIAAAGLDAGGQVWDASTGTLRSTVVGRTEVVTSVAWSPDSTRLVTSGSDTAARIWRVGAGPARQLLSLSAPEGAGGGVAFSPDGTQLMGAGAGVRIWDVGPAGDAEWANLPGPVGGGVEFMPDGRRVAAGSGWGSVTVWDLPTNAIDTIGRRAGASGWGVAPPFDVSPDGKAVAITGPDTTVRAWEAATGRQLFTITHPLPVLAVAWSPDGTHLITAGQDGKARITDRLGRTIRTLPAAEGCIATLITDRDRCPILGAQFSPDGRLVAVSYYTNIPDKSHLAIWAWEPDHIVRTISTPALTTQVAFDPSGSRLTAASGATAVWDADNGTMLATLAGHPGPVTDVAVSPDGTRVATAGDDTTVRLFEADTGRQILILRGHSCGVTGVAFSPDGTELASESNCDGVRVWALDIDDLLEIARQQVTRSLTSEECRQYLHLDRCPPA
ncbi:MAG TPA: BTAD domain-containing putative transcriptional regulator [Actinomycetes bacterium]|nr:BTAD domain-containing putative transcriptional regulator [Actinomycetes bacterium]